MRRKIMPAVFIVLLTAMIFFHTGSMAADIAPGSPSDPLVSKSYIDDRINQLLSQLSGAAAGSTANNSQNIDYDTLMGDIIAQLEFLYWDKLNGSQQSTAVTQQQTFVPVNAVAGQIILGEEGTEIILRSGKADGFCPGANGLVNVTDGSEVMNWQPISQNNLLIVPRNDGRGVIIREDAWFIIKGSYRILN